VSPVGWNQYREIAKIIIGSSRVGIDLDREKLCRPFLGVCWFPWVFVGLALGIHRKACLNAAWRRSLARPFCDVPSLPLCPDDCAGDDEETQVGSVFNSVLWVDGGRTLILSRSNGRQIRQTRWLPSVPPLQAHHADELLNETTNLGVECPEGNL
jgi:hypothetical protein